MDKVNVDEDFVKIKEKPHYFLFYAVLYLYNMCK